MTCKDCIHYDLCDYWLIKNQKAYEGFICSHFEKKQKAHLYDECPLHPLGIRTGVEKGAERK